MSLRRPRPIALPQPVDRRQFLGRTGLGIGALALTTLLRRHTDGATTSTHFRPRARRVICLFQSGGPSQVDLFDHKPELAKRHGEELPDSVRRGQRLTTMTADQSQKPLVASPYRFARHGTSGAEISELLPHTASVADELCIIRSLHTDAINHDPAITFFQTGSEQPGRPSFGSWVVYGLGSESDNLPAFTVMISGGEAGDQPLNGRLWGAGFLPPSLQGVKFRGQGDPMLYLANPPGIDVARRRRMLDTLARLNRERADAASEAKADIETRVAQFELAFRMQSAVPELTSLNDEPAHVRKSYGEDVERPGSFAANCLLARRMVERGVRFVQLYHRGWDHHFNLPAKLPRKCRETDQPAAALIRDLKRRGLLEDTLVIWAGEFGRTVYCQGTLTDDQFGRDHHPRCFSVWLAGGGVRAGTTIGRTDDWSYNIVDEPVHVHDLQATILHCLGFDHERLTYRHQGRDFRLTDIAGRVARSCLASEPTDKTDAQDGARGA